MQFAATLRASLGRHVRAQDVAWLLFISALAAASPSLNDAEIELLLGLALLQVCEPRVAALRTPTGRIVSIALKLVIGYLLIGVSGGVSSSYYPILLIPVVSAATTFGPLGTVLFTAMASLSYLSFLIFIDWQDLLLMPRQTRELSLRVLFLSLIAYLTYQLVAANREQAREYQNVAEQLAEANRNLRRAEAEVRRSDRLAALGQLTAGLAHELRNPLGTIKGSADVLRQAVSPENEVARELADIIGGEVDRTNSLITRFLDFARPLRIQREPAELHDIIDRAVGQLDRHQPPLDVSVYKNYSPEIPPMQLDSALMESVVFNLLENAAQASPEGGAITVKTRRVPSGVELSVIDRGQGIAAEDAESVFNPFYTTKSNGVGLGLAVVSRIVDEHGGRIAVESEPGQGSVFRVFLPSSNTQ